MSSKKKQNKPAKLFPQEQRLVRRLGKAKGALSVLQLGAVVFTAAVFKRLKKDRRVLHQRIGTIAFRINKKRSSFRIVPAPDRSGGYVLARHH